MAVTAEEFLNSFYNLEGSSVGERQKSLHQLLRIIKDDYDNRRDHYTLIFKQIQPRTKLEQTFHLEILIHFKCYPELLEVLSTNQVHLWKKLLKCQSFFQHAFNNLTGEYLVDTIFSNSSYSIRAKVLTNLAKHLGNPQKGEEFFHSVAGKYGSKFALKLLPCCGEDFIKKLLATKKHVNLTDSQARAVLKRYPHMVRFLHDFTEHRSKRVMDQICRIDFEFFSELYLDDKKSIEAGRRLTKKLLQSEKEKIVKDAQKFLSRLCYRQLVRSLGDKFEEFYFNLFPDSIERFNFAYNNYTSNRFRGYSGCLYTLLRHLPRERKLELLFNCFSKKYGMDLLSNADFVDEQLLSMLQGEEREKWAEIKSSQATTKNNEWYCYYSSKRAIKMIKERIALTSDVDARAKLVGHLLKTCSNNNDYDSLAEVCTYVTTRHRNDNIQVKSQFLDNIRPLFDMDKLDARHWSCITEMLNVIKIGKENYYYSKELLIAYVKFQLKQNLPIRDTIKEIMSEQFFNYNMLQECPEYEKKCLSVIYELIPEVFTDKDERNTKYISLLSSLLRYNKRHPDDRILLETFTDGYQVAIEDLKKDEHVYELREIVEYLICHENKFDSIADLYFANGVRYYTETVMEWVVKNRPFVVLKYLDALCNCVCEASRYSGRRRIWLKFSYYQHLDLPQKLLDNLMAVYNKEENEMRCRTAAISILPWLIAEDVYFQAIAPLLPQDQGKLDMTDPISVSKIYDLQVAAAEGIYHLNPSSTTLHHVLSFCLGDFMKTILRSLYHIAHQASEKQLQPFLTTLYDKPASVKKHAIFLTTKTCPISFIKQMLNRPNEKNPSIRKFLFTETCRLFSNNPDVALWELLKSNIKQVDPRDTEAFKVVCNVKITSPEYVSAYIQFLWDHLSSVDDEKGSLEEFKTKLLRSVDTALMRQLPKEFCYEIARKHLLRPSKQVNQREVQRFVVSYITCSDEEGTRTARLNAVFELIKNYVRVSWANPEIETEARGSVYDLLQTFCSDCTEKKRPLLGTLQHFENLWNGAVDPTVAFEEHLWLRLTIIFQVCSQSALTPGTMGGTIAKYCDDTMASYTMGVSDIFYDVLESFVKAEYSAMAKLYEFLLGVLSTSQSVACALLVLYLVGSPPTAPNLKVEYEKVLGAIKAMQNPTVRIHLARYVRMR